MTDADRLRDYTISTALRGPDLQVLPVFKYVVTGRIRALAGYQGDLNVINRPYPTITRREWTSMLEEIRYISGLIAPLPNDYVTPVPKSTIRDAAVHYLEHAVDALVILLPMSPTDTRTYDRLLLALVRDVQGVLTGRLSLAGIVGTYADSILVEQEEEEATR